MVDRLPLMDGEALAELAALRDATSPRLSEERKSRILSRVNATIAVSMPGTPPAAEAQPTTSTPPANTSAPLGKAAMSLAGKTSTAAFKPLLLSAVAVATVSTAIVVKKNINNSPSAQLSVDTQKAGPTEAVTPRVIESPLDELEPTPQKQQGHHAHNSALTKPSHQRAAPPRKSPPKAKPPVTVPGHATATSPPDRDRDLNLESAAIQQETGDPQGQTDDHQDDASNSDADPRDEDTVLDESSHDVPKEIPSHLAAEWHLIRRAQQAFVENRLSLAKRLVAQHRKRFYGGTFSEERRALDIRIDLATGRQKAAMHKLQQFRQYYPESIFLPEIEKALEGQ